MSASVTRTASRVTPPTDKSRDQTERTGPIEVLVGQLVEWDARPGPIRVVGERMAAPA